MDNMKGFTLKKFLIFILVISLITFLTIYFIKKISKSADKVALESANAIYDRANVYYVNTMMLTGKEEYMCDLKESDCDELRYVSTTKPIDGFINIYKGTVNAKLVYRDKVTYYICNNVVTDDSKCILEQSKDITYRIIENFYNQLDKEEYEGYYCNFENKKCDDSFNRFFEHSGEILIDKKGIIEAKLSVEDFTYYICNDKVTSDNCLIEESYNKILESLNNYYKNNKDSKDKKFDGFKCDLSNCEKINYETLIKPKGEVNIDKTGKITGKLIYSDKEYYICNGKISEKECE